MEINIKTAFSLGDRVWMPDGKGGIEKGRVTKAMIMQIAITEKEKPKISATAYECENIEGSRCFYQEWQLIARRKDE